MKSLPNQEEAKNVLYQAIMNAYNHFENQNENQIENQNECAYISISLSVLSINILNLLSKNIVFKEYSSNYGGRREESGRPKKTQEEKPLDKVMGKINLKKNQYLINNDFSMQNLPDFELYRREVGDNVILDVYHWLISKKMGKVVDYEFICRQIVNFSKRQGLI